MDSFRRFSTALMSPALWANYPWFRVERRSEGRVGQPRCFLMADESGAVSPVVYVFRNRHPAIQPRPEEALRTLHYGDFDELIDAGWRPHSAEQVDVGLDLTS